MKAERRDVLKTRLEAIGKEFRWGNQKKAFDALLLITGELLNEVSQSQTPAPTPAATKPTEPTQPTPEQIEHRCSNYPAECCVCSPVNQNKCGVEEMYRKPPA